MLEGIILEELVEEWGEADFPYTVQDVGRFRVNALWQRGSVSIVVASSHSGCRSSSTSTYRRS